MRQLHSIHTLILKIFIKNPGWVKSDVIVHLCEVVVNGTNICLNKHIIPLSLICWRFPVGMHRNSVIIHDVSRPNLDSIFSVNVFFSDKIDSTRCQSSTIYQNKKPGTLFCSPQSMPSISFQSNVESVCRPSLSCATCNALF